MAISTRCHARLLAKLRNLSGPQSSQHPTRSLREFQTCAYFWTGVSALIGRTTPFLVFVALLVEILTHGYSWFVSERKKNCEFKPTSLNLGSGGGAAGFAGAAPVAPLAGAAPAPAPPAGEAGLFLGR